MLFTARVTRTIQKSSSFTSPGLGDDPVGLKLEGKMSGLLGDLLNSEKKISL